MNRLHRLPLVLLAAAAALPAQFPTDDEVAAQIRNDGVLEIRFPRKTRGEKVWDAATRSWYWQRGVVVVRSAGLREYPDATVEIGGLARYFITGEKVSYQKFLVTWNRYLGIPAPSHADVAAMAEQRLEQLVGSYRYGKIVGGVHDLAVAADHRTEWHTPHSFSIDVACRYREIVSYTEIEAKRATFRVRFYRDGFESPWKERIVSTLAAAETTGKSAHDADEIRAMPTLASIRAEQRAREALAALPQAEVPAFGSDQDVFDFVYRTLRERDAKAVEAVLIQVLAPSYFHDRASGQLNAVGARIVRQTLQRGFEGKSTFAENYGPELDVKRRQRGMIELWNRTRQVKTRIAARRIEDPATGVAAWYVTALEPWTLQKQADLLRLRRMAGGGSAGRR